MRHLLVGLLVWWLAMVLCYFAVYLWTDSRAGRGQDTAVALANQYAKRLSVPLLDRDAAGIHSILNEALAHERVLLASVFDHQNTAVALVGSETVFSAETSSAGLQHQVATWKVPLSQSDKWMGLQAPIHFADVPIGQIRLYVSDFGDGTPRVVFGITALASLLTIVLSFLASRFRIVRIDAGASKETVDSAAEEAATPRGPEIRCPLCGTLHPLSETLFNPNGSRRSSQRGGRGFAESGLPDEIDLRHSCDNQDVVHIRKKVILRCTEIIQKLTA
ncbi:MAG TPA: hypothetical protein ACFCUC_09285 [Desulfobacterales bacterium]